MKIFKFLKNFGEKRNELEGTLAEERKESQNEIYRVIISKMFENFWKFWKNSKNSEKLKE